MQASRLSKILSVRLPEPEIRRFKSIAASRGVTVQEAVHRALESWASEEIQETLPESLDSLQGSLADVDIDRLRKRERKAELVKDRRWY